MVFFVVVVLLVVRGAWGVGWVRRRIKRRACVVLLVFGFWLLKRESQIGPLRILQAHTRIFVVVGVGVGVGVSLLRRRLLPHVFLDVPSALLYLSQAFFLICRVHY